MWCFPEGSGQIMWKKENWQGSRFCFPGGGVILPCVFPNRPLAAGRMDISGRRGYFTPRPEASGSRGKITPPPGKHQFPFFPHNLSKNQKNLPGAIKTGNEVVPLGKVGATSSKDSQSWFPSFFLSKLEYPFGSFLWFRQGLTTTLLSCLVLNPKDGFY